ncbi:MAG: DUF624 domain-containing protein [Bacilli bacterium]|nr:DUF624 domain-containing protein [Bacilli bacterium]
MKSKIFNSKAYQVFDYICRLIILNILLIGCSFSIFLIVTSIFKDLKEIYQLLLFIPSALTLFPSIMSVFGVIKGYELDGTTGVFKEYFRCFKKYYLKSLLFSIMLILYIILISNSYSYFNNMKTNGVGYLIGYLLTISFVLISIFCFVHLPLTIIYFDDLNLKHYIKLSFIFAFKDLGLTIILTILSIISIILSYYFNLYLLILSFSLTIFLIVKLTKSKYIKIYERNKDNEKNND